MSSYQHLFFAENLTLSWANPYTGGAVVMDMNDLSPTKEGLMMMLPFAHDVSPGTGFILNNVSAFAVSVIDVTLREIAALQGGDVLYFYLIDTSDAAGEWRVIPWGGGVNALTALTAQSSDASVLITDGKVSPPGGVIDFQLPSCLSNLTLVKVGGLVIAKVDDHSLTFQTGTLQAGANIILENPDGLTGNPLIGLSSTLSQLVSLETQGLHIEGSTLTALENDLTLGNLHLQSSGNKGVIALNPVTVDRQGNMAGIKDLSLTGRLLNSFIPKAWCCFVDNGQKTNNIILQDSAGVASVTGSQGSYVITFAQALPNGNYGFALNIQKSSASNFVREVFMQSRSGAFCIVYTTDAQGNLIPALDGVSVEIFSSSDPVS